MKKLLAVLMAVAMLFTFAACGGTESPVDADQSAPDQQAADSDMAYVKEKGTLVVGITDFSPMDYKAEGSDEWIGFDADMAKEFAKHLGVDVEFVEIVWDQKVMELNGKNIDCVWNGMTLNDQVLASMSCSDPYCINSQVIVVPADKADQYKTADACKELKFAVEGGSAGKDMAEDNGFNYTEVDKQATALMEVAAGTSDAAIIDSLMAGAMIGEGTGFEALTYTAALNSEEYGVGFRQGSDLTAEFNQFFKDQIANGKAAEIAETYGVQEAVILK